MGPSFGLDVSLQLRLIAHQRVTAATVIVIALGVLERARVSQACDAVTAGSPAP